MKKLDISITKAQLVSFRVQLKDLKPEISVSIALLTEGNKAITEYTISTDSWNSKDSFELPIEVLPLLGNVARILEAVAVKHCRDCQKGLEAGQ